MYQPTVIQTLEQIRNNRAVRWRGYEVATDYFGVGWTDYSYRFGNGSIRISGFHYASPWIALVQ